MKKISILVPIFNEEENIKPLYEILKPLFFKILNKYEYEILFLDNASDDNSRDICLEIKKNDNRVIYIKQSRNFGYQANILMGYHNCSGDCAIVIDADGQDDPNLIVSLIENWEKGYDVVYGIRKDRDENIILKNVRKFFYRILNLLSEVNIPADAGDFRLVNRKIIENIKLIKERSIYLRGLISHLGFKQIGIEYIRKKRKGGRSKFSLFKNYELAEKGILSFTKIPLQLITLTGFVIFLLSIFGIFFYLWLHIFKEVAVPGFTTIILIFLFFFGLTIFFIGIVALYIGLILDEVKKRPRFIVDEKQ